MESEPYHIHIALALWQSSSRGKARKPDAESVGTFAEVSSVVFITPGASVHHISIDLKPK
jgi:hypothetical protein